MLDEARTVLRSEFLTADVGITGANMLIAETGSIVLVTNEGNGDLTQTLPKVQIVIASIEKVVPTLEDAATILRLLARSATGQDLSVYTTFTTGPKRPGDLDGPDGLPRRCSSTTAARPCSATSSARCCAASAAAPASTIARSMARSAAMPTAGSIPGRWARC